VPALRGGDCSPTFIFRYLKCAPSAQSHPTFLVPLLPLDTTPNATGHEVRHFDTRKLSGEGTVRAIPTILVLLVGLFSRESGKVTIFAEHPWTVNRAKQYDGESECPTSARHEAQVDTI
jgi:hypothetical protein